jgi:hypothetical protein
MDFISITVFLQDTVRELIILLVTVCDGVGLL